MWSNLFLCLFLGWMGAHKFKDGKIGMGLLYLFTFGLFGIGWLVDTIGYFFDLIRWSQGLPLKHTGNTSKKNEKFEIAKFNPDDFLLPDGSMPEVIDTSLMLRSGEVCYYSRSASRITVKNKVVGHTGGTAGASIRVMKGVTYRKAATAGHAVRENVVEECGGKLSITNKRIIFASSEGGFDKKIGTVSTVIPCDDGLSMQIGSQNYIFKLPEPDKAFFIIKRILSTMDGDAE